MKRQISYCLTALASCLAALFLCSVLQPKVTYTVSDADSLSLGQYEAQVKQAVERIDGASFDTLYTIRTTRIFGKDEVFVLIPYVCGDITSVRTAGSFPWNFTAGVAAMRWRGGKEVSLREIEIKDAKLMVTADPNTAFPLYAGMPSNHGWEFPSQFPVAAEEHSASVCVECSAVTRTSTVEPNANCSCEMHFEGVCAVPHSCFSPLTMVDFCVDTDLPYINNVTDTPKQSAMDKPSQT